MNNIADIINIATGILIIITLIYLADILARVGGM